MSMIKYSSLTSISPPQISGLLFQLARRRRFSASKISQASLVDDRKLAGES